MRGGWGGKRFRMPGKGDKRLFYNELAASFDSVMNMYDTEKRLRIIYEELLPGSLKGKLLLDAGCGTGWFSKRASEKGASVVSSDIGVNLLKVVASKCASKRAAGDLTSLPFKSNTFDIVVCSEAIEHTVEPRKALTELTRVLRPGGTIVLTVPNRFWFWSCWLANKLKLRPYEGLENWVGFSELKRWSEEAGVKVEKEFGFHMVPFVLSFTHPLIDVLDRIKPLGPFMVNIALKGIKR